MVSRAFTCLWRFKAQAWPCLGFGAAMLFASSSLRAQSLDSRLDEDQFLRGLGELGASEVLEQYIATHPTSDAVRLAQFEIARQRIKLADAAMSSAQRLAAVERLLAARADLLSQKADDDRRVEWFADQATDLFFELLPIDASGLTTIVGVPSMAQRERAGRVAREMNFAVSQAENELDRVLAGPAANNRAVVGSTSTQRRNRLIEQERQRRIPFLRGVSNCLQAQTNVRDAAQQKALFAQAAEDLSALIAVLDGVVAIEARLYAALAQLRLGRLDEADANLTAVITHQSTSPAELFLARMLSVMTRAAANGPKAAMELLPSLENQYQGADKVFYRLLIADQRFLLRRAIAQSAPADQRPALMTAAYSAYTDLLKADLGIPRDTLRAAVFAKLADSADRTTPIEALPSIVTIARADQMTRSSDPQTLQDAVVMLDLVLGRSDLDSFERSTALFARARSQYSLGRHMDAARGFLELAEQTDADANAGRAAELAASIAAEALRERPQDPDTKALFNRALTVLLSKHASLPTIDRWRVAAGQLALDDHRYDEAIKALSAVDAASEQWPEAQYLMARAAARRAGTSADRSAHEQALTAIDRATSAIEGAEKAAATDADRRKVFRAMGQMLRGMRGEELLSLGRPQKAIDSLTGIENESEVDRVALAEALRVRIAAFQAMQQPEKAAAEITRYLEAAPEQALGVIVPLMDSLQAKVQALIDSGQDEQAAELARSTLLPVATIVQRTFDDTPPPASQRVAVMLRMADAHRLSGEYAKALAIYESQLAAQPDLTGLVLGRAECLYDLGGEERLAEAMNAYKRLSAAGISAGANNYWLSQLRMLQILDAINRNTSQIMPRIERLRQQDANFGGEQFRRGFDALRQKYTGK